MLLRVGRRRVAGEKRIDVDALSSRGVDAKRRVPEPGQFGRHVANLVQPAATPAGSAEVRATQGVQQNALCPDRARAIVALIVALRQRVNVSGWLLVVLLALLTEVAVQVFELHDTISPPSETLAALAEGISSGELLDALRETLEAYVGGLALAIVVGVLAGVLIGSSRLLLDASFVVLEFLRPIPAVALIPLAILFFGLGSEMRRYVVAYAAVWPILVNTLYGVRGSDRILHEVAMASGVSRLGRLVRVTLPAALPSIATGIRVSASIGLLVAVTAEFVTGTGGGSVHTCSSSNSRSSFRRCTPRCCSRPSRLHDQRRAPTHRAPRPALERRGARQVA